MKPGTGSTTTWPIASTWSDGSRKQKSTAATRLYPADPRARQLLEALLAAHAQVLAENPDILARLHDCDEAPLSTRVRTRLQ